MADAATVYDADDLRRHSRAVLAAARRGEVHVRDRDGVSLAILPEQRVRTLRTGLRWAANLFAIERALTEVPPRRPTREELGGWAWLEVFDDEDLRAFAREMREALMVASSEETPDPAEQTLHDWQVTAASLRDPVRREILLGRPSLDDFVEVSRPE